eukprot:4046809-Amphidinium_carterae.1
MFKVPCSSKRAAPAARGMAQTEPKPTASKCKGGMGGHRKAESQKGLTSLGRRRQNRGQMSFRMLAEQP